VIVRGRLAVRLAGRRREAVPATLWEGLAHLALTGAFHRHVEVEPLPAEEIERRLRAAAQGLGWATDGALRRTGADGVELSLEVSAAARHPRGKPAATLELLAVPLPPAEARGDPKRAERAARLWLGDRALCEQRLAEAQEQVERLLGELAAAARTALPVESVAVELERGLPHGWSAGELGGLPEVAVAWVTTLDAMGTSAAWLDALPPRADGGGLFDVHGADGGGAFDAGAGHHDGGGAL